MLDFLFNPNGRISRKGYLVAYFLPYFLLTQIGPKLLPQLGALWMVVGLFLFWPSLVAVPVKRFHDMGATGWYHAGVLLLFAIALSIAGSGLAEAMGAMGLSLETLQAMPPEEARHTIMELVKASGRAKLGFGLLMLVSFGEFLLFALVRGTSGSNRYGNDPLADGRGFAD
ncbi:MAG: DUF805 domain-containing protein [Parvularcula sp.]